MLQRSIVGNACAGASVSLMTCTAGRFVVKRQSPDAGHVVRYTPPAVVVVSAIFAITTDLWVVDTSNTFAVFGFARRASD